MHSTSKLRRIQNSGLDVLSHEVAARVGRQVAVKGKVASLRADHNLVPAQFSIRGELFKRSADISFRPLMPVIYGRIEYVDAGTHSSRNGFDVLVIGGILGLTEIGAQSDRGQPEIANSDNMLRTAEVSGIAQLGEAIAIARRAFDGGMPGEHRGTV